MCYTNGYTREKQKERLASTCDRLVDRLKLMRGIFVWSKAINLYRLCTGPSEALEQINLHFVNHVHLIVSFIPANNDHICAMHFGMSTK